MVHRKSPLNSRERELRRGPREGGMEGDRRMKWMEWLQPAWSTPSKDHLNKKPLPPLGRYSYDIQNFLIVTSYPFIIDLYTCNIHTVGVQNESTFPTCANVISAQTRPSLCRPTALSSPPPARSFTVQRCPERVACPCCRIGLRALRPTSTRNSQGRGRAFYFWIIRDVDRT